MHLGKIDAFKNPLVFKMRESPNSDLSDFESLCYLAGLIDGEGCLSIIRHKQGVSYSACLQLSMSIKGLATLNEMRRRHGGAIRPCKGKQTSINTESAVMWGIHHQRQLHAFLSKVKDLLDVKRRQAEILFYLLDNDIKQGLCLTSNNQPWTEDRRRLWADYWEIMRTLNGTGRVTPIGEIAVLVGDKILTRAYNGRCTEWCDYVGDLPLDCVNRNDILYHA